VPNYPGALRPVRPRRAGKSSGGIILALAVLFLLAVIGGGAAFYAYFQPLTNNTPVSAGGSALGGAGNRGVSGTVQPEMATPPAGGESDGHLVPTIIKSGNGIRPTAPVGSVVETPREPEEPVVEPAEHGEAIASVADGGKWVHRFVFQPDGSMHANSVAVAGDFNGWSRDANPMQEHGGVFDVTLPMDEGLHRYKFVINGDQWIADPNGDRELQEADTYGAYNSGVLVGPDARGLPPPDRKTIRISAVRHSPGDARDCDVVSTGLLQLSLRVQADNLTDAAVWTWRGGATAWVRHPLTRTDRRMGFDRYTALLAVDGPYTKYMFELVDGATKCYIASGKAYKLPESARTIPYKVYLRPTFETPEWAKHVVWYQIFPERFRNGDPSNDPPHTQKWTSKWFSTLPGEKGKFYNEVWFRRYGGDLQGVMWSLPYLRKLGVNAIYLNPIFKAADMHKYDTTDYRHVDDNFGFKGDYDELKGETEDPATWQWTKSDKLFLQLIAEAHRQGFKIIIDGVFNHVGRANWAFQDVLKNGRQSKYADWFDITSWEPFHYHAWDGDDGALPVLRKDNATGLVHGPREHIMAITKRWLAPDGDPSKGVDGFRLDVPNDVPHPFWVDWRKLVKETHPGAYITGEIWTNAQPWLQGDQFDATMNYPFAKECQRFFVNVKKASTPSDFAGHMQELIDDYPFQVSLVMQNLFDSHDTDRFASMFVNPDLEYDQSNRIQDNGPNYSPAKPTPVQYVRMRQAVAFQMTFVGAPMIYYGDENGMWSPDDPSNRQPMVWQDLEPYDDPEVKFNPEQFEFYQRAIAIRRQIPALQVGLYHTIRTDNGNGTMVFSRSLEGQSVYVVLNRSNHEQRIDFRVDSTDGDTFLMDFADRDNFALKDVAAEPADSRPMLVRRMDGRGKRPFNGMYSATLPAYGTAVLARPPALQN
jgi:cyclomaltodextrinase / maltogenic alpha-amylase / neopullulanase